MYEDVMKDVGLDKEAPIKFWKSSRSGLQISGLQTPDPDRIRTGSALAEVCALGVLLFSLYTYSCYMATDCSQWIFYADIHHQASPLRHYYEDSPTGKIMSVVCAIQGTVTSPLLYSLCPYDCLPLYCMALKLTEGFVLMQFQGQKSTSLTTPHKAQTLNAP